MSIKAWDIETTIRSKFKRKASPFDSSNWVVTHGFMEPGGRVTEHRFGAKRPGPGWLLPVLQGTKLLAGFNIKFDLLHALQDPVNLDAWMQYVADGGNVWDVQLAEYLLEGADQRNHMLALDEVAPRYGGDLKFDEVKALWGAGVDTHEIEPALLSRYLCGDGTEKGDVENTMTCALAQIKRARECGQLNSILLNMGSLLCSIEMERNGMFVDKQKGLVLAAALAESIDSLSKSVNQYLPPDLPFEFNWTNRYHLSPLIFGGKIKYQRREYSLKDGGVTWDFDGSPEYAYAQKTETHYILLNGTTMECSWYEHCCGTEWQMECNRAEWQYAEEYKSGKNAGERKTKRVKVDDYDKPKSRMADCYWEFPGFTKPKKAWASSTEGLYSVASDVIEELGVRGIPFLAAIAQLQKLTKDLGTYYIVVDEDGTQKGMLSLVDEFGIIHHKINHTSTVTTRFSSSDPNLQNIPKGQNSDIKTVFVSRFGEGGVILQSDFSSLEVYVQAILTKCRQLIADLRAGLDMHVKRLALKEGISYDECFALCKGDRKTDEWDYKRTDAKVFSFQRAYGAGAEKIAASTGMAVDDVKALIAAEENEYPEIAEHFAKRVEQIRENRRPAGIVIPHPEHPGVVCNLGRGFVRTPDGQLYSYLEAPSPEYLVKKGIFCSFSPTIIKNYEVQGTGGTWMKAAMWLLVREFYRNKNFGGRGLLVNTVHDAAYADAAAEVKLQVAATIHACMEAASDFMAYWFAWDIPIPVPSDTSWGASMMDEDKVPGLKELADPIRIGIRGRYMADFVPSYN